mgnify:CR=1 FL=1|tara:strand:+ start:705 stop:1139 length:435 start_codon:yes stop_codon:yes gene_type:complete
MNSFEFTHNMLLLPYHYNAKIIKVTDGDTVTAEIDLGFHTKVTKIIRVYQDSESIYFDTPEIKLYGGVNEEHKRHGLEATERAKELLLGKDVIIHTYKKGSFRWLGEIYYPIIKMDSHGIPTWWSYVETMINEGFQKKDKYSEE